jgi:hypothetical protein
VLEVRGIFSPHSGKDKCSPCTYGSVFFQSVCSGQKFVASVLHEVHLKKGRSARSYYKVVNEVELRRRFLPEIRAMVVSV